MNDWRPFVYGGIASVTAECGTYPIDTTKIRLQVQGQTLDKSLSALRYRGMLHALVKIISEEGVSALYSGLGAAVLRQASYGTIKIGIYHSMKELLSSNVHGENLSTNVVCGVSAGVIASAIANPTDVLKVRLQVTGNGNHQGLFNSFVEIARKEGVCGLWRGVGPTANRAAVVCGVELPAYDYLKHAILVSGMGDDGKLTHFCSSFLAGLAGAIASNPIDVIKTRLMNQKRIKITSATAVASSLPVVYSGSIHCFLQTYQTEGFLALYKGFIPNWLRLGPWNIIFFMTFEHLKQSEKSHEIL